MNPKRRIFKIFLYVVGLLALGGLWAFGQFFFYPWEGSYESDVASLIPRDIDFYLAKAELEEDFDPFPKPVFVDGLLASPFGKALQKTPAYQEFLAGLDIEASLKELDTVLAQLPIEVDPLSVVGGRDLAIAGYFSGTSFETADWAVYARTNWIGKLGFGIVQGGFGLEAQGLKTEPILHEGETAGLTLSGGQLTRPIHLARVNDVLILASKPEFIQKSHELVNKNGADSLLQSGKYFDHISKREGDGDELEMYLDYRALAESLRMPGSWPNPHSKELGEAMAGKIFQLASIREAAGTLGFGSNIRLDLTSDLSSNVLTSTQKALYRERDFERNAMKEVAQWVPADAGALVYGHADLGVLMREAVASMDPDTLALLEDLVRSVWGYADIYPLLEDLSASLRDRFAFCMRNYDYPPDKTGPENFADVPVPAWALILWIKNKPGIDKIRDEIQQHQREFALEGKEPGSQGVFTIVRGGLLHEYWNPFVPGTGHIATLEDTGTSLYLIISNENRMLGDMFATYHTGGATNPRLSESPAFKTWVDVGLPNANLIAWWNPMAMGDTLRKMARSKAAEGVLDIDWQTERPRIEREILQRDFPGQRANTLGGADRQRYDQAVQEECDRFQANYEQSSMPGLMDGATDVIDLLELTNGTLVQLGLDHKQIHLHARVGLNFGND